MPDLHWYAPLEHCTTLDAIRLQWQGLLDEHHMTPAHDAPRYQDAMLAFLGGATLPPHLKLGAVLACGASFDFDLRLAVGLLEEHTHERDLPWPDTVADAVMSNGPALPIATDDAWLGAFVAGRLAGLRETFAHDGVRAGAWQAAFWNKYLDMACRHADAGRVRQALQHGADPRASDFDAVSNAAQGAHAGIDAVLLQLVGDKLTHDEMLAAALPAAAAVDNTDLLAFLRDQGADIRAAGARALAAAARNAAYAALDWLIAHGADVHADDEAALIAAVASLDEGAIEILLAAGADLHACGERALHTALTSSPHELYAGVSDLAGPRADTVALLARHGVPALRA